MSLVVAQPTTNETPDAAQGGAAVAGITNTGHGATSTSSSATGIAPFGTDSDSDSKSARWFGLQNVGGQKTSVRLKFSWSAGGSCNASGGLGGSDPQINGNASSSCSFQIEYSLNGGSNWTTHVSDSASASSSGLTGDSDSFDNDGSADIALSNGQDVSQIQVRALYQSSADAEAGPRRSPNARQRLKALKRGPSRKRLRPAVRRSGYSFRRPRRRISRNSATAATYYLACGMTGPAS